MKQIKLNSGHKVPVLGLGTWRAKPELVGNTVRYALQEAGYKHIDCASIYRNEKEIGQAFSEVFKSKKVKRDEVFITSKLWNTDHKASDVETACKKTLKDLQLEHLDLYLMHWGVAFQHGKDLEPLDKKGRVIRANISIQETWAAMENLVKKGLVKSIGVANFTAPMLVDLLSYAKIKPAMEQVEIHPYNSQTDLVNFCKDEGITVTAYSSLGTSGTIKPTDPVLLKDRIVLGIAKTHKKTPAQILLNWAISRGVIVIPKSVTKERIKENIHVFDFELTPVEVEQINKLNINYRFVNPGGWWKIPYFN